MRTALTAIAAAAAALVIANMLGVASAEAPTAATSTAVRSVNVQGVATVPLEQGASAATATAAYRQAMANAVADGLNKAEFLAGRTAVTLGAVQTLTEDGGSIECKATEQEGPDNWAQYTGEQPDFGHSSAGPVFAGAAAPRAASKAVGRAPAGKHKKGKRKGPKAKRSAVAVPATCALNAQVSLVYAIS
ncbi:MAG TPA: hypothetical protein VMG62_03335 [Solirubrobacteraceae bacterium]|nr:hypothetical protein [Solirubrobacteraceae bacterium]